eukprot:TCALIF_02841-PA protein Name:"Protein of unknown function" AED:0.26 eAED:0.30 QI:0/-1/0/1/-1/1/1/0/133
MGRTISNEFYVLSNVGSDLILGHDLHQAHRLSFDAVSNKLFWDPQSQSSVVSWEVGSIISTTKVTIPAQSSKSIPVQVHNQLSMRGCGSGLAMPSIDATSTPICGHPGLIELSAAGHAFVMVDNPLDVKTTIP